MESILKLRIGDEEELRIYLDRKEALSKTIHTGPILRKIMLAGIS